MGVNPADCPDATMQKKRTMVEKSSKKTQIFFKVYDQIKYVRIEITARYAILGKKVSRKVFCTRWEKIEAD